jgi:hypothetical protein
MGRKKSLIFYLLKQGYQLKQNLYEKALLAAVSQTMGFLKI